MFILNPQHAQNSLTAQQVLEKCKGRAIEIDDSLKSIDIQFTQEIEFKSRGGGEDSLAFDITIRHGKFEREMISSSVANGNRFNGGYDAFDRMFFLSDYFDDHGKKLTSCELEDADCSDCYGINFTYSKSSDTTDPLNVVSASLTADDFTPVRINEQVTGLPLGAEFDDDVKVFYDKSLNLCYPASIVMRVYAHLFFLKGEIAVVNIKNKNLKRI